MLVATTNILNMNQTYFNMSNGQFSQGSLTSFSSPSLGHTIVSELDPFPVKKSQKFVTGEDLLSSWCVCLTQMLFSVEPLRLEQLPLLPTLNEKLSWLLRSWS